SRRRHTRSKRDWSSDVCSSDLSAQFDGFNFDSLRIVVYDPAAQPGPSAVGDGTPPLALGLASPSPNPMRTFARFSFTLPRAGREIGRASCRERGWELVCRGVWT